MDSAILTLLGESLDGEEQNKDQLDYVLAVAALSKHFSPKLNVPFERHVFRQLRQEEGESMSAFVAKLRKQAKNCDFKDLDDQLRDQVISNCFSSELRREMLRDADITIQKIEVLAKSFEAVRLQVKAIESKVGDDQGLGTSEQGLNQISRRTSGTKSGGTKASKPVSNKSAQNKGKRDNGPHCYRCGQTDHFQRNPNCPARSVTCSKCHIKGHLPEMCRTKSDRRKEQAHQVRTEEGSDSDGSIFHIGSKSMATPRVECSVGGVLIPMLIDSGASCSVIGRPTWEYLKAQQVKVQSATRKGKTSLPHLYAYGQNEPIELAGKFSATIAVAHRSLCDTIYVMEQESESLLSRSAAEELGVLKIGLDIKAVSPKPKMKKMTGYQVEIPLKQGCQPIHQPYRRPPFALKKKVEAKIGELLEQDIIEPVNEPAEWCSPWVPVSKNGEVRLCIDFRRVNESVLVEKHSMPTIEEFLPDFAGHSSLFFKLLGLKDAYLHLELKPESRGITTFMSSQGMFRFKRLPFGLSCAPELFQKMMSQLLQHCEGTKVFIDDVIIFAQTKDELHQRVSKVTTILETCGL